MGINLQFHVELAGVGIIFRLECERDVRLFVCHVINHAGDVGLVGMEDRAAHGRLCGTVDHDRRRIGVVASIEEQVVVLVCHGKLVGLIADMMGDEYMAVGYGVDDGMKIAMTFGTVGTFLTREVLHEDGTLHVFGIEEDGGRGAVVTLFGLGSAIGSRRGIDGDVHLHPLVTLVAAYVELSGEDLPSGDVEVVIDGLSVFAARDATADGQAVDRVGTDVQHSSHDRIVVLAAVVATEGERLDEYVGIGGCVADDSPHVDATQSHAVGVLPVAVVIDVAALLQVGSLVAGEQLVGGGYHGGEANVQLCLVARDGIRVVKGDVGPCVGLGDGAILSAESLASELGSDEELHLFVGCSDGARGKLDAADGTAFEQLQFLLRYAYSHTLYGICSDTEIRAAQTLTVGIAKVEGGCL